MKIRGIGFLPKIYGGMTSANFHRVAIHDGLTTKNLQSVIAPNAIKAAPQEANATANNSSGQSGKPEKK
jgi:hypothetical protein